MRERGRRKALSCRINDVVGRKYPIVAGQADKELLARYGVAANELDRLNATIITEKADAPGQWIADLPTIPSISQEIFS